MSTVSAKSWDRYIKALRKLSDKARDEIEAKILAVGTETPEAMQEIVRFGYAVATKYGEATGALAAEMYDALAELSGMSLAPAMQANTATYGDVAKAIYGTKLQSSNPSTIANSIGRLVKMTGADTMLQNAMRDGAYYAWIPRGDTCAFCLTLASQGWQKISAKSLKNGHAEHIHANCDCTYAIRFGDDLTVEGYDPDEYKAMYDEAEGRSSKDKINYMRREFYQENKEEINAQKRDAYEKRQELNGSAAEEINVGG